MRINFLVFGSFGSRPSETEPGAPLTALRRLNSGALGGSANPPTLSQRVLGAKNAIMGFCFPAPRGVSAALGPGDPKNIPIAPRYDPPEKPPMSPAEIARANFRAQVEADSKPRGGRQRTVVRSKWMDSRQPNIGEEALAMWGTAAGRPAGTAGMSGQPSQSHEDANRASHSAERQFRQNIRTLERLNGSGKRQ